MKKAKNNDTIKMVLNYIKKYRISVVLSLLFAAVTVVLTLYLPVLTGDAVDYMLGKGMVDFERLKHLLLRWL